jgi:hypothetical protein
MQDGTINLTNRVSIIPMNNVSNENTFFVQTGIVIISAPENLRIKAIRILNITQTNSVLGIIYIHTRNIHTVSTWQLRVLDSNLISAILAHFIKKHAFD